MVALTSARPLLMCVLMSTLPCFLVPSKAMVVMRTSGSGWTAARAPPRGSEITFALGSISQGFVGCLHLSWLPALVCFFSKTHSLALDH